MKTTTAGLLGHLQGETQTLSTCWKVTRQDGQIFAFTDSDDDITYNGVVYKASTGITPTSIETTGELNVDNMDVEGVLADETITDEDLHAGLWDYAAVETFLINRSDTSQGVMKLRKGRLGEVKTGRVHYSAELRGITQNLQQNIGGIYTAVCQADFCDSKCKLSMSNYQVTGSVTQDFGTDKLRLVDSSRTETDKTFKGGVITFTSGLNVGFSMEVKSHDSETGELVFQQPMPFFIQAGDEYSLKAGCDKLWGTCQQYVNTINFRGFPHVPGKDKISSGTGGTSGSVSNVG